MQVIKNNDTKADSNQKTTHFGYAEIPIAEKVKKVGQVFSSVAAKYDLMNDLMSFGLHRIWKKVAIELSGVRKGQNILDVAGGTGDLTSQFAKCVGPEGQVILSDINYDMLLEGRNRLLNKGIVANVLTVLGNAEQLPFSDNYFDVVSISFGLRNVTDKQAALQSMYRVLQPGGRIIILEFSKPSNAALRSLYDQYSFNVIPRLGQLVANDKASYQYLVESIRKHPDQASLINMMQNAGFEDCRYFNLCGGIVAIHRGYKY